MAVETIDALVAESAALTKALTGLTCGGSEFFNRKGDRYVADIDACVAWVKRRDTAAHDRWHSAVTALQGAQAKIAVLEEALRSAALNLDACAVAIKHGRAKNCHELAEEWARRARAPLSPLEASVSVGLKGVES